MSSGGILNGGYNYDSAQLAEVWPVVEALTSVVRAERIMIVGARCRDLLHARFVGGVPMRSTNDTDMAIAMPDWREFEAIRESFDPVGESGHRFRINGIVTDVIPFGDVEHPAGTTTRPPQNFAMNVHGFRDAFARADLLPWRADENVRIPRAEGYAVLKAHAWLDRSPNGEYKDAGDLALAVYWYSQDIDMLYAENNFWAMERYGHDLTLAAAALVGTAMRNGLSGDETDVLRLRFEGADTDLLVHHFGVGKPGWPRADRERRPIVDALVDQL